MLIPEKIKLLYIEDDEDSADVIINLLKASKHTQFDVVHKMTLRDGLNYLEKKCKTEEECEIDIILLDLILPNSHGVETYKSVVKKCSFLPIVIISGYEEMACECIKLGAQDYLVKPHINSGFISRSLKYAIERNRLEKNIKEQHNQLIAMFDGMDEIVYVSDPETHEILYMNKAIKKIFGDGIGKKCYNILQGSENPCDFCSNGEIFGNEEGRTHIWEFKNKINNRWYRCVDRAIKWPDGRLVRFELAIDITDLKNAEDIIKESEKKFRNLVEITGAGIYEIDLKTGKFIYVNDVMCRQTGWSREELMEMGPVGLLTEKSLNDWMVRWKKIDKTTQYDKPFEYEIKKKDGGTIWGLVVAELNKDDAGNVIKANVVAIDITKQKLAEKVIKQKEEVIFTELEDRIHNWKKEILLKSTIEMEKLRVMDNKLLNIISHNSEAI